MSYCATQTCAAFKHSFLFIIARLRCLHHSITRLDSPKKWPAMESFGHVIMVFNAVSGVWKVSALIRA